MSRYCEPCGEAVRRGDDDGPDEEEVERENIRMGLWTGPGHPAVCHCGSSVFHREDAYWICNRCTAGYPVGV